MTAQEPAPGPAFLSLEGISKRFGERWVLEDACLQVALGEVHALLGENGAGKSTLMNVLSGVYSADRGEIRIDGQRTPIRRPADAAAAGIGMVHQHFRLVERFTAAENLLLAAGKRRDLRTLAQAEAALLETAERIGLSLDPKAVVEDLSVAERQRVEICKVLALGAKIVVLDEPTAVLTDREAASMLAAVRRMAEAGHCVILITHKLREVLGHSHRLTVMRQGRTVASNLASDGISQEQLARLMVGEHPPQQGRQPSQRQARGADLLVVKDLQVTRAEGGVGLDGIDLSIRAGEILGIAGVGGNGQQQLADALAGTCAITAGSLQLDGADVTHASVAKRRDLGLRVIPSDRMSGALIGEMSVAENLALTKLRSGLYRRFWLNRTRMRADAQVLIEHQQIAGAAPGTRSSLLSGGNAQKIVLARELASGARLLVAHSPTRGLDVKACAAVHAALREAAKAGAACLLISEDLEEIMHLCDRIAVLNRGRIVGEQPGGASAEAIGQLMLGHA